MMAAVERREARRTLALVQALNAAKSRPHSAESARAFHQFQRELIEKLKQYDEDAAAGPS